MPDHPSPKSNPEQQTALPGFPGGVRLDLLDPAWIVHAAQCDGDRDASPHEPITEAEDCVRALQQRLFDADSRRSTTDARGRGGRYDVARPELDTLRMLANLGTKRYDKAEPTGHEHTAADKLAHAMWCVWLHTARPGGLSHNDLAVQAEWRARSLDVGYLRTLSTPMLPIRWLHLAGERESNMRRAILFSLMHAIANGWLGLVISATEGARLWGRGQGKCTGTWWRAVAWLEEAGLLVRMNEWRRGEGKRQGKTDKDRNWYGPGPKLLQHLDAILADRDFSTAENATDDQVARFREIEGRLRSERAQRARAARDEATPGKDAPTWALDVVEAARAEACQREIDARDDARAAAGPGDCTWIDELRQTGEPAPELDVTGLDVEASAELERLAELVDELPPVEDLVDELVDRRELPGDPSPPRPSTGDVVELDGHPAVWVHGGWRRRLQPSELVEAAGAVERGEDARLPGAVELAAERVDGSLQPISPRYGEPEALEPPSNEPARPRARPLPASEHPRPARPPQPAPARVATKATHVPVDPWGRIDWSSQEQHTAPLAAWAEANAVQSTAPPDDAPGGPAPPRAEVQDPCRACRDVGLPWGCPACGRAPLTLRDEARAKLRDALDGKRPELLDRLDALVGQLSRDEEPS